MSESINTYDPGVGDAVSTAVLRAERARGAREAMTLTDGDLPPRYPIVGGHEGSGVIEEVGPGVTKVKTATHTLEEVNQVYQDLRDGKNIRGVIIH